MIITSARPLGPNTSKATTPITNASGAPTPSNEACTPPAAADFLDCLSPLTKRQTTMEETSQG